MKKTGLLILASGIFALAMSSCGGTYTPLTQEQITAKADSLFTAQKENIVSTHDEACAAGMDAAVTAKMEILKAEAMVPTK